MTWAYEELRAGTQAALAALIVPEMMAWIETGYATHRPFARDLNNGEKELLKRYFPPRYVEKVKVHYVSAFVRPELWGDGRGVTYYDAVTGGVIFVLQNGEDCDRLLLHEMVHAYQYKQLGLSGFCWQYILTWVKSGFVYREISLEDQAYTYVDSILGGNTERVGEYLGY